MITSELMDRDRVKASIPGMRKRIHLLGIITEEHEGLQNTLCVFEVLWTWIFKKPKPNLGGDGTCFRDRGRWISLSLKPTGSRVQVPG